MNLFFQKKPYFISGPCGAETEQQMLEIAEAFKHSNIDMIRAGAWKPRSQPGHFEGKGEEALKWLHEIKIKSGKKICTEVANPAQVELALKYNLDAVWLGARTTVNPFLVQEIAEALRGSTIAVMVKNPINPDVDLWNGAIERIKKMIGENIAAIHRGFSTFDNNSKYRNKPLWAIPIELKRRNKDLPIFCDVSHICGQRNLIADMAQRALDLNFDGLMIESHPNPDAALSDAKQQLTPQDVLHLISTLKIRQPKFDDILIQNKLEELRQLMDSVDAEIIELLTRRKELSVELGHLKIKNNMPIYLPERWREIFESRTEWAEKQQLSIDFIGSLFELVHNNSIKMQMELFKHQKEV